MVKYFNAESTKGIAQFNISVSLINLNDTRWVFSQNPRANVAFVLNNNMTFVGNCRAVTLLLGRSVEQQRPYGVSQTS